MKASCSRCRRLARSVMAARQPRNSKSWMYLGRSGAFAHSGRSLVVSWRKKNMRSVGFQGNTQRTTLLPRFFWGDPLKRYVHAGSPSKSVRIPLGGCWDAAPNNWCGMLFTQSKYRFIVVSVLSPLRWRLALPPTFSIGRLNQRCARCRRKRTGITIWCAMSPNNGCLPEQSQAARQSPVALQS